MIITIDDGNEEVYIVNFNKVRSVRMLGTEQTVVNYDDGSEETFEVPFIRFIVAMREWESGNVQMG